MKIKVSIVVAVYNTAQHLAKCIESLLNQTLEEIEIILINDGSTDDSKFICDYYAALDPRVRCLHQANSGPSAARNNGINISNGKYLAFVDSDDYVEKNMYETMYKTAEKYKSDIVICNFSRDCPDMKTEKNVLKIEEQLLEIENIGLQKYFSKYWLNFKYANYVWNKLYKKTLFVENEISFPEDIRFSEDRFLNYMLIPFTKRVAYIKDSLYHYVQRHDSLTNTQGEKENLVVHYIKVFSRTLEWWRRTRMIEAIRPITPVFLCRMIQGAIYTTRQANNSDDYVSSFVHEATRNSGIRKQLLLAAFGKSVTIYRKEAELGLLEEFRMRGFALSCLLGKKGFKTWQKIYNLLLE